MNRSVLFFSSLYSILAEIVFFFAQLYSRKCVSSTMSIGCSIDIEYKGDNDFSRLVRHHQVRWMAYRL